MSQDNSLDFDEIDQSLHIAPLRTVGSVKPNNNLFSSSNPNMIPTVNKCLKVLSQNKINDKWIVNQQFQNYLAEDDLNPDGVIVSFLGAKKNGKSFLIDSLVTAENEKVCRMMSKNCTPLVNCPAHSLKTRNNDRVIYLDMDGETSKQIFLWAYFLSSIIVYNMSPYDKNQEDVLFDQLYYVQSHLDSDFDDLSLPQLIIVRRDVDNKVINDRDLLQRIQQYNLFDSDILCVHLPYPGSRGVKAKQLLDVPLKQLNPSYLNETQRLLQIIKTGKPKIMKGNYLSSKILSIAIEPVTRSINKQHRINTTQIWNQIIETLSVGFYNFYLKTYSEQLKKQFQNEKPCDRYTMYKKLSKLKRRINKRVEGFNNIADDPIFIKQKNKLEQVIKNKQQLMKDVNTTKSRNANQQYCKKLLSQINDDNYAELIDEYCRSELDQQKTEVLLQNFDEIMKLKAKQVQLSSGGNKKPTLQLQRLEKQINLIQKQIGDELKPIQQKNVAQYDVNKVKTNIQTKKKQLQQLQSQYEDLKNASKLMSKSRHNDERIIQLQEQCQRLNQEINQFNKEIDDIKKQRQKKIKQTTMKLDNQLKVQEQKLKKLQQMLRETQRIGKPGKGQAQGGKKDTCCIVM